jgi:hypothetical protein
MSRTRPDLDRLLYPVNRVFDIHSGIISDGWGFRNWNRPESLPLNVVPRLANINRHRTSMRFFLRWTETLRVTRNPQFVICDSRFTNRTPAIGECDVLPASEGVWLMCEELRSTRGKQ